MVIFCSMGRNKLAGDEEHSIIARETNGQRIGSMTKFVEGTASNLIPWSEGYI